MGRFIPMYVMLRGIFFLLCVFLGVMTYALLIDVLCHIVSLLGFSLFENSLFGEHSLVEKVKATIASFVFSFLSFLLLKITNKSENIEKELSNKNKKGETNVTR